MTTDIDPNADSRSTTWRAQQADALIAVMKAYLDGGHTVARAGRRRIGIR